jgi:23S rRNA pseudouridine1911/1915/1917 synthase
VTRGQPALPLDILLEDNHCLAVDKPGGLLSQGDASGDPSALDMARAHVKEKYRKPGAVYLGLVHRLDRPVSGVLLFARTSKAAARLSAQFREGSVAKTYWAIVEGRVPDDSGTWTDRLVKDARRNVVEVEDDAGESGREAVVDFRVLGRAPRTTWLELRPKTGRSHQLRVQLAARGWPIVGDRKYGADSRLIAPDGGPRIALHARSLGFNHPTQRRWIEVTAPVPAGWPWPPS